MSWPNLFAPQTDLINSGVHLCVFRLGADPDHLAAAAVLRLQGELAKDGREPMAAPKKSHDKLLSAKANSKKSSQSINGKGYNFSYKIFSLI